jgi:hypothetical protein
VNSCVEYSMELLNFHSQLRPITKIDIDHFIQGIRLSAQFWADELRDAVCSQLLLLKSFGSAEKFSIFDSLNSEKLQEKTTKFLLQDYFHP